jgi:transcriptional regulator with XRE-family HTH domain
MTKRRPVSWNDRANQVIDEYERGLRRGRLTQARLASLLGVSRQTLWRSEEIQTRLRALAGQGGNLEGGVKRPSSAAQIRALRIRIGELETVNQRLVQNFIVLCRSLDERGLDPIELMGVSAPDLVAATRDAIWR